MPKLNQFILIALVLGLFFNTIQLTGQESKEKLNLERIIKLIKFIDWSQNKSFQPEKKLIYVLTDDKSGVKYDNIARNNSMFKDWTIICLSKINNLQDGSVIFITKTSEQSSDWIIKISSTKNILTIAENSSGFCNRGGMINIMEDSGQVKFEINYRIIQDKSIDISSKLLALSKIYD